MIKRYIYAITFLLLTVAVIVLTSDYAFSVVPGWHMGIGDNIFKAVYILVILLVFSTIGYTVFAVKKFRINPVLFSYQFLTTLLILILLRYPLWLWRPVYEMTSPENTDLLVLFVWGLFWSGQIWLYIYLLRTKGKIS
ncbi:hypothetical protein D3C72_1748080 [compost metagenome]